MTRTHTHRKPDICVPMPDFERLQFYYGRTLTVADLQTQQQYFLEKLRLHARCFHGTGIVCGLGVTPVPVDEDCESDEERRRREAWRERRRLERKLAKLENEKGSEEERAKIEGALESLRREHEKGRDCHDHHKPDPVQVQVECGWALDCEGREIIVRAPVVIDLRCLLSRDDRREIEKAEDGKCDERPVVELSICYCEQPTYPTRPVVQDNCDLPQTCKYGRLREGYRFRVSLTHQPPDPRCSNCCEPCVDECVVLARITWPEDEPLDLADIDWRPRREISVYQPTVIDGISWLHGATYDAIGAKVLLGTQRKSATRTDGIEVRFSKAVYAETLQPGVVDLWRVQGGQGLAGVISHIEGSFVDKPDTGLIDHFKYRDDSAETLNTGDRVLIIVRGDFILDACCQPVDGEHVGGLVPQLPAYAGCGDPKYPPPRPPCADRPKPWTSGNGRPGATFESWFFIE